MPATPARRSSAPTSVLSPGATYRTPFGVERHGLGYGQPMTHPLADATLKQVHDYPWPDPKWMDVSQIRAEALAWGRQYAILGGDWSPFWHDAIDLLGMENLLLKMYDEPELVDALLEPHRRLLRRRQPAHLRRGGGCHRHLLHRQRLRQPDRAAARRGARSDRFMLPHLQRLARLGHAYGLKVMLHCCGGFAPLMPAMIEAGLDGLHALQPSARGMEPAKLKAAFGDQILFNGCIDSHHVLIDGTPELVRTKTREVLDIMKPGGGYIAGASHDYILEETPVENVLAMFDTARDYGCYG